VDAPVAIVGLLLLANLIGLLLGLWACFREVQGPVPILPTRSRTRRFYRFNLLLASLGPPASCCGEPGLEAGLLSGFTASCSVISISNYQGMQFSGDHFVSCPRLDSPLLEPVQCPLVCRFELCGGLIGVLGL